MQSDRPYFLHPGQTSRATYRVKGLWRGGGLYEEQYAAVLLPVPRTWLGVALAVVGAVAGIWVSRPWWRGAAWRRGECGPRLVPCAGLGAGRQAVVGRLGGLGGIVLGREGSRWVLLGSLRWMGWLLATLEAWSWAWGWGRSLGGGRSVVLELLLLRRLLLLLLWWARLRGSGLSVVSYKAGGINLHQKPKWLCYLQLSQNISCFI